MTDVHLTRADANCFASVSKRLAYITCIALQACSEQLPTVDPPRAGEAAPVSVPQQEAPSVMAQAGAGSVARAPDAKDTTIAMPTGSVGTNRSIGDAAGSGSAQPDIDAGVQPPDPQQDRPVQRTQWTAARPKVRSMLVGMGAKYRNPNVNVYGSDMAATFVHDDKVIVLFGDTYMRPDSPCETQRGTNDDMIGLLPLEQSDTAPVLDVVAQPDKPDEFARVRLLHEGADVVLDQFKVPLAGWSDGADAYAAFIAQEQVTCDANAADSGCPHQEGVHCMDSVSLCKAAPVSVPVLCEPQQPLCLIGGCRSSAVCVDTRSSQYDGSSRGRAASVLSRVYIGKARSDLATFDSVATWRTNLFAHPATRTVKHFSGTTQGADYGAGHGDLLIWGRPGISAEQGRESRIYFATASLPLETAGGELRLRYFAGMDPETTQPRWSSDAAEAKALAMDGKPNGDAHEKLSILGTTTVSWLGAPVNQWVMMYGGDLPDHLLADANGARRTNPQLGSIVMRFAHHPWGPWSLPITHLPAGSPSVEGDAYGPGGILYHDDCEDPPNARCAQPHPYSLDLAGRCVMRPSSQLGRLYAPAIVDAYTRPNNRGGLDITWAISTWQPYAAFLMQTSIEPATL